MPKTLLLGNMIMFKILIIMLEKILFTTWQLIGFFFGYVSPGEHLF